MKAWAHVIFSLCLLSEGPILIGQDGTLPKREPFQAFGNGLLPDRQLKPGAFILVEAFPNLSFPDPIGLVPEPRSDRLYVYTRQGLIYRLENHPTETKKTLFLDLRRQTQGWDDSGLVGLAFHPEFGLAGSPNRGYFYVFYQYTDRPLGDRSHRPPHDTLTYDRLSRFTLPDGSPIAATDSELVLIDQRDRSLWHNGGDLFFSSDGRFPLCVTRRRRRVR